MNGNISLNGTYNVTIVNNVSLYTQGRSIQLFSGLEYNNTIDSNLIIKSDFNRNFGYLKNSALYFSNLDNTISNNVVVNNPNMICILISIPINIVGSFLSEGKNICLNEIKSGIFTNNSGIMCETGLKIDSYYNPKMNQCDEKNLVKSTVQFSIKDLYIFGSKEGVYIENIGNFSIDKMKNVNNTIGLSIKELVDYDLLTLNYPLNQFNIRNSEFISMFSNVTNQDTNNFVNGLAIILPTTSGLILDGVTFTDYTSSKGYYCMKNYPIETNNIMKSGGNYHYFRNIIYKNTDNYILWENPKIDILVDLDGTLTRNININGLISNKRFVMSRLKHLLGINECVENSQFVGSIICTSNTVFMYLESSQLDMNGSKAFILPIEKNDNNFELDQTRINMSSINQDFSSFQINQGNNIIYKWIIPVVTAYTYYVKFFSTRKINIVELKISLDETYLNTYNPINIIFPYYNQLDFRVKDIVNDNLIIVSQTNKDSIFTKELKPSNVKFPSYYDDRINYNLFIRLQGEGRKRSALIISTKCLFNCQPIYTIEDRFRRWSEPLDWPSGKVPKKGDNVVIESNWRMIIDVTTEEIGELRIKGVLFPDSSINNIVLNTHILIIEGTLLVGTLERPFKNNFTINIVSKPDYEGSVSIEKIKINNFPKKVIVNVGNLSLNGEDRSPYFSKLLRSCFQTKTIRVSKFLKWKENDKIAISSTNHNMYHQEIHTIESYNSQTGDLTLKNLVQFKHYGNETEYTLIDSYNDDSQFDERAEIIMLTRNIKIQKTGNLGGSLINTNMNVNGKSFVARFNITNIEINELGDYTNLNLNNPAFSFIGITKSAYSNKVDGIIIKDSEYTSLNIKNSESIDFSQIGILNSKKVGLQLENSNRINLDSIIVMGNKNVTFNIGNEIRTNISDSLEKIDVSSCYEICANQNTCSLNKLKNIVCTGSEMFGYISQIYECDNLDIPNISVSACQVGILMTNSKLLKCGKLEKVKSFNNIGYGVVIALDAVNLKVSNLILSNNLIGLSINSAYDIANSYHTSIEVSNSTIIGINQHNFNLIEDNLKIQRLRLNTTRQIGLLLPTNTQKQILPPLLNGHIPFEKVKSKSGFDGRVLIDKILFSEWTDENPNLPMSAISSDLVNEDKSPLYHFKEIKLLNVMSNSLMYLNVEGNTFCKDINCLPLYQRFIIFDKILNSFYSRLLVSELTLKKYLKNKDNSITSYNELINAEKTITLIPILSDEITAKLKETYTVTSNYSVHLAEQLKNDYFVKVNTILSNLNTEFNEVSNVMNNLSNKIVLHNNTDKILFDKDINVICRIAVKYTLRLCDIADWFSFNIQSSDNVNVNEDNKNLKIIMSNSLFTSSFPDIPKNNSKNSYLNYSVNLLKKYKNYVIELPIISRLNSFIIKSVNYYYSSLFSNHLILSKRNDNYSENIFTINFDSPRSYSVAKILSNNQREFLKPIYIKMNDNFNPSKCGDYTLNNLEKKIEFLVTTSDDCFLEIKMINSLWISLAIDVLMNEFTNEININNFVKKISDSINIPQDLIYLPLISRGSTVVHLNIIESFKNVTVNLNEIQEKLTDKIVKKQIDFGFNLLRYNYTFLNLTDTSEAAPSLIYDITTEKWYEVSQYVSSQTNNNNNNSTNTKNTTNNTSTNTTSENKSDEFDDATEKSWTKKYWWVILIIVAVTVLLILLVIYFFIKKSSNMNSINNQEIQIEVEEEPNNTNSNTNKDTKQIDTSKSNNKKNSPKNDSIKASNEYKVKVIDQENNSFSELNNINNDDNNNERKDKVEKEEKNENNLNKNENSNPKKSEEITNKIEVLDNIDSKNMIHHNDINLILDVEDLENYNNNCYDSEVNQ